MIVDLYARVSGDEQAERGTVENQIDFFRRWCDLHKYTPGEVYADEAVSGRVPLEQRPEGARLLAAVREKRAAPRLALYRLDRIGRDPKVCLDAVAAIESGGVVVQSLTEPFDTVSPAGRLMLTMLAGFAGFERDSIVARAAEGQRRKAANGGWLGGSRAAYGYRVDGKRQHARLAIDTAPVPEWGPNATRPDVVRWIFQELAQRGASCRTISNRLNAQNVPGYLGGAWNDAVLCRMVKNPVYKGEHHYGHDPHNKTKLPRTIAAVPALVSSETWERANAQILQNRRLSAKNSKRLYLLRGLIWCADCGSAYTGLTMPGFDERADATENRVGVRYRCNVKASRTSYVRTCPGGMAISGELETEVWEQITRYLTNPAEVARLLTEQTDDPREVERLQTDIERLKAALVAKGEERAPMYVLHRKQLMPLSDLETQLVEIAKEEAVLQSDLERAQKMLVAHHAAHATARQAAESITLLAARLRGDAPPTREEKRELIEHLVERITVKTVILPDGKKDTVVTVSFWFSAPPRCSSSMEHQGQIAYVQTLYGDKAIW